MSKTCTISSWIVKPSRNGEFVAAWQAYAKWLVSRPGLTSPSQLFRDSVDPAHYMGIDYWQDKDAFTAIQTGVDYGRQLYKLQQLAIHFSSWTLNDETDDQS
jgi:heme-degrading monooxygenase HmoA